TTLAGDLANNLSYEQALQKHIKPTSMGSAQIISVLQQGVDYLCSDTEKTSEQGCPAGENLVRAVDAGNLMPTGYVAATLALELGLSPAAFAEAPAAGPRGGAIVIRAPAFSNNATGGGGGRASDN
ncbi:MAG: hypothetical protein OIF35_02365, partial [Cellvibrionaceae bacterium]|nr:hypothetical protein [Cellvibrionaceae bacterium]